MQRFLSSRLLQRCCSLPRRDGWTGCGSASRQSDLRSLSTNAATRTYATWLSPIAVHTRLRTPWPRFSGVLRFNKSEPISRQWYSINTSRYGGRSKLHTPPPSSPTWRRVIESIPSNWIIYGILGLNGAIYIAWQYAEDKMRAGDPSLYVTMYKNLLMSWQNVQQGRIWTVLTCCFSHSTAGHIFMNAFTFYFMAPSVIRILGNVSFLSLYLGGGIVSSLTSLLFNQSVRNRSGASNGASGAIYAVVTLFACVSPRATFLLFGIVPMPAWLLVTGIFMWDGLSAVSDRKTTTDSAGHVGGILAGIGYYILKSRRLL